MRFRYADDVRSQKNLISDLGLNYKQSRVPEKVDLSTLATMLCKNQDSDEELRPQNFGGDTWVKQTRNWGPEFPPTSRFLKPAHSYPLRVRMLPLFKMMLRPLPFRTIHTPEDLLPLILLVNRQKIRGNSQHNPLGEGHGNPLQCSCLENPMDKGVWWATVHGFTESDMTEVT